ncbi:MAG: zinc metallopeptidase [Inconstantimicrobium porci]|uniref:Zinc metallopeptidase n=1 Tax=Inconstantimicrobium porci TaxID=2652291 RepID=A0A7X2T012_9CLOT|nr:zinc metallopeptidase [Inconstantimicrobium porci]MDD6772137.1 zinc metallopeptidase [Inconstantimicrobium porci]MDY5911238.1 zinc metallopeptidase [Inconstantimicrobium porci]MSR90106.1 zinc metallopeptidase [Inconstantimicrobium porci]
MFYFDPTYIILVPAMIIAAYAQMKVNSTFAKFSEVQSINGYSGSQTARRLLDSAGLYDVPVELVNGRLTDHYDPRRRVLRLSRDVFYGTSVASLGVASHEVGHAIQHKESYSPLRIRNSLVPVVNFSSNFAWIIFFIGIFMANSLLADIGIILFSGAVVFQLITLPVEYNASTRALRMLKSSGTLYDDELKKAEKVLDAAALTYLAAAFMAVSQIIRLIAIKDRSSND